MAGNYVYVDDATSLSGSQGPGPLPDNAYDRALSPGITASYFKSPNAIYFNSAPSMEVGFWFGSEASFDALTTPGETLTNNSHSAHYQSFGKPALGTQLNIHPNAYSASKADDDAGVITLIYSSGLSTGGR